MNIYTSMKRSDTILDKQIHIYSVDTSAFYNKKELKIHNKLNKLYFKKEKTEEDKKEIKKLKNELYELFKSNNKIRKLNPEVLTKKRIVSIFESTLTRTLGYKEDELTEDIFIVQTYFFDVLEDIILNGFLYKGEKYVYFTSSAGQIRTKKSVFIKEKS